MNTYRTLYSDVHHAWSLCGDKNNWTNSAALTIISVHMRTGCIQVKAPTLKRANSLSSPSWAGREHSSSADSRPHPTVCYWVGPFSPSAARPADRMQSMNSSVTEGIETEQVQLHIACNSPSNNLSPSSPVHLRQFPFQLLSASSPSFILLSHSLRVSHFCIVLHSSPLYSPI